MRPTEATPLPPPAPRLREGGFILPTTLLVMVLLTVMLTAAFILASAEFRATDNSLATNRALALAQAGLENYFSLQRNLDTSSTYDSIRVSFSSGYADVVGQRVRQVNGTHFPLWLIRSIGTSTDPRQPGQSQGQRAVAQLAELNNGVIPQEAAITAVNGILMLGSGTNPISGTNFAATVTGCTNPSGTSGDTAAYAVSSPPGLSDPSKNLSVTLVGGQYVYTKAAGSGNFGTTNFSAGQTVIATGFTHAANNGVTTITAVNTNNMTVAKTLVAEAAASGRTISFYQGNFLPGAANLPTGNQNTLGSTSAAYDASHIDWQSVLNGDFTPDFTNTLPATCSGSACLYNSYYWTGSVHVPAGSRRMLLISTGNVYLDSAAHVDGIIIAGGALNAYGGAGYIFTLHGAAITGLNCATSSCPPQDSIMAGANRTLQWSWCYTHGAIGGLNGLVPLKNTWVDTWSLY